MPKTGRVAASVVLSISAAFFCSAYGHDLAGIVAERSSLDPDVRAKIDEVRELRRILAARASTAPADGQTEAVVQTALRWRGESISVCFFDGRREARDHLAEVASRWESGTRVKFDLGPAGNRHTCDPRKPSNIRVSFKGSGY